MVINAIRENVELVKPTKPVEEQNNLSVKFNCYSHCKIIVQLAVNTVQKTDRNMVLVPTNNEQVDA